MNKNLKRVKINGEWYEATEWMGALELTKHGSPNKFKAKEPFAHISNLYHIFDANDNNIGEIDINNKTYSGNVDDYEAVSFESQSTSNYTDQRRHFPKREESSGCLVWFFAILGFLFYSNLGGRIGVIIGGVFSIIMIITTFSDNLPVGNLILVIPFALLFCGIIGAIIGAIVGFIKKMVNK